MQEQQKIVNWCKNEVRIQYYRAGVAWPRVQFFTANVHVSLLQINNQR